ncbi:hydroxyethylthiazole kinase [Phocea massiliensis]|jgi:hydroxyethylthiazole kinase|uniref:Hydroxyethylthiazole kinase n=1 Tax=uncultured Anaerotruncus sp. TaxID=905011 RepID=A0A6N2SVZ0_9FIRM|nr:hydroxyethylthiazole kinase [Merdimmobilis hominis]MCD4836108.1 hydroxyethylthiazole kinase [Merdimmobilis hominis]PWL63077.1 MAG: hydroxyethylthiazole kinase [Oscillospiraceae bacterium]
MEALIHRVRGKNPLVHCITNYVTAGDCANMLLACGGSPIMADDLAEAAAITAGCDALVLNLGTPHAGTLPAMAAAGKQANQLGHPVVLDPVGVGASPFRRGAAEQLFREVQFSLIRGNISEVKALLNIRSQGKGVDAGALDAVTEETIPEGIALAQQLWAQTGAAVAITGVIDLVADGEGAYVIRGGHPMLSRITGSGCMLSAVCGAFLAACPDKPAMAAAGAVSSMGLCGEIAAARLREGEGTGSFRTYLMDAMSLLDDQQWMGGTNIEYHQIRYAAVRRDR